MSKERPAFITGSYAYGKPTKKSDIDLVVYLGEGGYEDLSDMADSLVTGFDNGDQYPTPSLRFGKLNLICCHDEEAYDIWKEGTDQLAKLSRRQTISREDSIKHFRKLRTQKLLEK